MTGATGPGETYRKRTKNGYIMLSRGKEKEQEQEGLDLVCHLCDSAAASDKLPALSCLFVSSDC